MGLEGAAVSASAVTVEELHQEFKEANGELEEVFRAELATLRAGIKADFASELMHLSDFLPSHAMAPTPSSPSTASWQTAAISPTAAQIALRRQSRSAAASMTPPGVRPRLGTESSDLVVENFTPNNGGRSTSSGSYHREFVSRKRSDSKAVQLTERGRRKSLAGSLLDEMVFGNLAGSADAMSYQGKLHHAVQYQEATISKPMPPPLVQAKGRRSMIEKTFQAFESTERVARANKKGASLPDVLVPKRKSTLVTQELRVEPRVVSIVPEVVSIVPEETTTEVTDWDAEDVKSNGSKKSNDKDDDADSEASSESEDEADEASVKFNSETFATIEDDRSPSMKSGGLSQVASQVETATSEFSRSSSLATCRGRTQARLRIIVVSGYFDFVATCLVILNAIIIGVQADYTVRNLQDPVPTTFRVVETIFCVIFGFELGMRITAFGRRFFSVPEWRWNLFDSFVVGVQLIEEVSALFVGHDSLFGTRSFGNNVSFVRILRILRLVRIMRLVRLLRFIQELRTMVCSMAASMKSLLWTLVLLFLLIYVMAVYLTQMIVDHGHTSNQDILTDDFNSIGKYYGTLARALLSLFQGITGGIDWDDLVDPLMDEVSPLAGIAFVLFISFAVLAMMNVVTGIFVESALLTAKADKDSELAQHVRRIFTRSDVDLDGQISWEEFSDQLDNPALERYFKVLEIDVSEARGLFMLLDTDESGTIDAEEFVMGILRLRGNAKAIDLATLMYFNKRMMAWWKEWKCTVDEDLFEILERLPGGIQEACSSQDTEGINGFEIKRWEVDGNTRSPSFVGSEEQATRRKRHSGRKQTPAEAGLFATWADLKGEAQKKQETRKRDQRRIQRVGVSKFDAEEDCQKVQKKTVGFADSVASKLHLPNFNRPRLSSPRGSANANEDKGLETGMPGKRSSLESRISMQSMSSMDSTAHSQLPGGVS